jgi:hypothetical protein
MDSSAAQKRTKIRNKIALTANSANGVLIHDVASVLTKVDTTENQISYPPIREREFL